MATAVDPLIYSARPNFFVDGNEVVSLGQNLIDMVVEETAAGLYHCEATFANWGPQQGGAAYLYFDRRTLDFGKKLRIEAGGGVGTGKIFEGKITALEGRYVRVRPPELLVMAEDRLQDLRMTRRTRSFENMSDSDLVQQIASPYGLTADVDVTGPTHKVLTQVNQSDLAFLRERARAVDAEVWVDGDTLHAKARARRGQGDISITLGKGLLECQVSADLAGQTTGFTVSGWDVSGKQGIQYQATDSTLGAELNGDQSGATVLRSALGTRDQQIVHLAPVTSQEAQTLAESNFRAVARRFVTGAVLAEGDARLRVGTTVKLDGLGTLFDGRYYITRARHLFDLHNGFRTQVDVERPGIGQ
jgi:hypothetical protein